MRVLGIDPGSQSTGFGIIDLEEARYTVRAFGTIKPARRLPFHLKLRAIALKVGEIISSHSPDEVAIESPFYAQNVKTAIALGQVRGAVLTAVASTGRPLAEYSALEIKKSVTGYGRAEKQQVNAMVRALLSIEEEVEMDASDALAAAICHLNTRMFRKAVEESAAGEKR
jgi:crossover junction endodeoxyribonuclease RuvC